MALALLTACTGATAALSATTSPSATASPLPTDADNRAAAQAEAQRLSTEAPLPDGARRRHSAPTAALATKGGVPPGGGPMGEPNLVASTAYWTVPGTTAAQLERYLAAHPPAGVRFGGTGETYDTGTRTPTVHTAMYRARTGTDAYAAPQLDISYVQHGGAVEVAATGFVDWRNARTAASIVTGTVSSILVERRPSPRPPTSGSRSPRPTPPVTSETVTDPDAIASIEQSVNAMLGAAPTGPIDCPALVGAPGFERLTFRSTDGTWRFAETTFCFPTVGVSHDGTSVTPALDPGGFDTAVTSALRSGTPPPATAAYDRALSRHQARLLLSELPLPGRARFVRTSPDHLLPALAGSATHLIKRTAYWVVPRTSVARVERYFETHLPKGLTTNGTGAGGRRGEPMVYDVAEATPGNGTAAYGPPELFVSMVQRGRDVAVRADADVTWRAPRPARSLVTGTVTDVVARDQVPGKDGRTRTAQRTVTDPATIASLVGGVDALRVFAGPADSTGGCVEQGGGPESLTFHSDAGTWTFADVHGCWSTVRVTVDGTELGRALDPTGFGALVDPLFS